MEQGVGEADIGCRPDVIKVLDPEVVHLEEHVGSAVVGMGVSEPAALLPLVAIDRKPDESIDEGTLGDVMQIVDLMVRTLERSDRGQIRVHRSAGDPVQGRLLVRAFHGQFHIPHSMVGEDRHPGLLSPAGESVGILLESDMFDTG